jgi:hypothetical protein
MPFTATDECDIRDCINEHLKLHHCEAVQQHSRDCAGDTVGINTLMLLKQINCESQSIRSQLDEQERRNDDVANRHGRQQLR